MRGLHARTFFSAALLVALVARADPPQLPQPFSELVAQCARTRTCPMDCEGKLCALMVDELMPGHVVQRLWVGPRDSATAQTLDRPLPEGKFGLHWIDPARVELTWLSGETSLDRWAGPVSQTQVFQLQPDGRLHAAPPRAVPGPSLPSTAPEGCVLFFDSPEVTAGCLTEETAPLAAVKALRSACPSDPRGAKVLGLCNAEGCVLASGSDHEAECAVWIPTEGKLLHLVDGLSSVGLDRDLLSLTTSGGCRTGCDFTRVFRLGAPPVLEIPSGPLRVGGLLDVPPEASGRTSRDVECATSAHVDLGQEAWDGPKDLSARWTLTHGPGRLNLTATLTDDHLVPLAMAKAPLASDHLELVLRFDTLEVFLLEKGAVSVRRAAKGKLGAPEPRAHGTWSATPGGYRVQLRLPFDPKVEQASAELSVSDGDDGAHQKARMGTQLSLQLWKTYPPPASEVLAREISW